MLVHCFPFASALFALSLVLFVPCLALIGPLLALVGKQYFEHFSGFFFLGQVRKEVGGPGWDSTYICNKIFWHDFCSWGGGGIPLIDQIHKVNSISWAPKLFFIILFIHIRIVIIINIL